jgi:hypothetical protein
VPVVTPSDVAQLQADVRAEADALSDALKGCIYKGLRTDDPIVSQWSTFRARVDAFLSQSPSWLSTAAQMDAGQAIQRDLRPWYGRIAAKGCDVPPMPSGPPAPGDLFGSVKDIAFIFLLIVVARELR